MRWVAVLLSWLWANAAHADGGPLDFIRADEPGCIVGVSHAGRLTNVAARGVADLEHPTPIGADTLFEIGSVTKVFTAFALGLLVEDGRLTLDDDLRHYLPELPPWAARVKLRDLLHHTSGVRSYTTLLAIDGYMPGEWLTNDRVLDLLKRQHALDFAPGTDYEYSTSNYFLAGQIVERVSGQSLARFAATRIFAPLGMRHTQFVDDSRSVLPGRAQSYEPAPGGGWLHFNNADEALGSRGVVSTLNDVARFDANFTQRTVGGRSALALLGTPARLADGRSLTIAPGFFLEPRQGRAAMQAEGWFLGYTASFIRFPEAKVTGIALCNRASGAMNQLADDAVAPWLPPPRSAPPSAALPPLDVSALVGTYLREDAFARFDAGATGLVLKRYGVQDGHLQPTVEVPLVRIGPRRFRSPSGALLDFGSDGQAMTLISPQGWTRAYRRAEPPGPVASDRAGDFRSDELGEAHVRLDRGQLSYRARFEPWQPLVPVARDVYFDGNALFRCERAVDGRVQAWSVASGGARGVRYLRER